MRLRYLLPCLIVIFAFVQLLPAPSRTNPKIDPADTIEVQLQVPPRVEAIIQRSCKNCHSNETTWPFYSKVAPASWAVAKDVENARKAMNLSEWGSRYGRRPGRAAGILMAACADLRTGRMPLKQYVLLHPGAKLSNDEAGAFCDWAREKSMALSRSSSAVSLGTGALASHPRFRTTAAIPTGPSSVSAH